MAEQPKELTSFEKEYVRRKVQDGVAYNFEPLPEGFKTIIWEAAHNHSFSNEETDWALRNLDWKVIILEEVD